MAASGTEVETVVRATADVGEGPVWTGGELRWVELSAGRLHVTDPATGADAVSGFGGVLGAVVPSRSGRWAAISGDGFGWLSGDRFELAAPVTPDAGRRMNDGKCDPGGRFWAGSTTYGFAAGGGALHRWDGASAAITCADGLALPNGMGWSVDGTTMYLVDSMPRVLFAFDFDVADGTIAGQRVLAEFGERDGLPDGLCVDAEDCLWVAFYGAGCLRRLDPSGRVVAEVATPVSQPTSCAFGDGSELFITSARENMTAEQLAREPLAGSLFRLDARVPGAPVGVLDA